MFNARNSILFTIIMVVSTAHSSHEFGLAFLLGPLLPPTVPSKSVITPLAGAPIPALRRCSRSPILNCATISSSDRIIRTLDVSLVKMTQRINHSAESKPNQWTVQLKIIRATATMRVIMNDKCTTGDH